MKAVRQKREKDVLVIWPGWLSDFEIREIRRARFGKGDERFSDLSEMKIILLNFEGLECLDWAP
jgi:hypothetical protein